MARDKESQVSLQQEVWHGHDGRTFYHPASTPSDSCRQKFAIRQRDNRKRPNVITEAGGPRPYKRTRNTRMNVYIFVKNGRRRRVSYKV